MTEFEIRRVNPLDFEKELKRLFVENGRPEFPEFFDRAYPSAVREGAVSWIGVARGGTVMMHLGRFPKRFRFAEVEARAGLFVNLMAAPELRTFFPAFSLLRSAIDDSRNEGLDFVYADPNAPSAAIVTRCGFGVVGHLRRFVLPLRGHDLPSAIAARVYRLWRAATSPSSPFRAAEVANEGPAPDEGSYRNGSILPHRPSTLFRQRLSGYPGPTDRWVSVVSGEKESPVAWCLTRGPGPDGIISIVSVSCRSAAALTDILVPVVARSARSRARSMQAWTVEGSDLARALGQCGFRPRPEHVAIRGLAFNELGEGFVRRGQRWEITDLDCDR